MSRTRSAELTCPYGFALPVLVVALLWTGQAPAAPAQATDLTLRAEDLLELQSRFAKLSDDLPEARKMGMDRITAYEENAEFVYAAGPAGAWTRRVVFLKPGVFVVDDLAGPSGGAAGWKFLTRAAPRIAGGEVACTGPDGALRLMSLLPGGGKWSAGPDAAGGAQPAQAVRGEGGEPNPKRYVHAFVIAGDPAGPAASVKIVSAKDALQLTVAQGDKAAELALPPEPAQAGTLAAALGQKEVLARRLLPSGIMPHGSTGVALLERWDKDYRRPTMPGWDAGRVSSQLKKAVEEGPVKPGRALDLGCGTGTNAIYLAEKGFEVTGLDVAPSALRIADDKARKAGVKVRWIVGDAANPPEMEPFDFIFDRGCYHHVRWVNRDGFVAAVTRLTKPGGQFLLLSFRAADERAGKPYVKETQVREDFSAAFEFEWLRPIRFDSRTGIENSAPAWTAMMRRKN